jgi:hypothetical protein
MTSDGAYDHYPRAAWTVQLTDHTIDGPHARNGDLFKAVGLFEEVGQVLGYRFSAGAKCYDALEIPRLVFVIGNGTPIAVAVLLAWPPAGRIPFDDDAMNAIRR